MARFFPLLCATAFAASGAFLSETTERSDKIVLQSADGGDLVTFTKGAAEMSGFLRNFLGEDFDSEDAQEPVTVPKCSTRELKMAGAIAERFDGEDSSDVEERHRRKLASLVSEVEARVPSKPHPLPEAFTNFVRAEYYTSGMRRWSGPGPTPIGRSLPATSAAFNDLKDVKPKALMGLLRCADFLDMQSLLDLGTAKATLMIVEESREGFDWWSKKNKKNLLPPQLLSKLAGAALARCSIRRIPTLFARLPLNLKRQEELAEKALVLVRLRRRRVGVRLGTEITNFVSELFLTFPKKLQRRLASKALFFSATAVQDPDGSWRREVGPLNNKVHVEQRSWPVEQRSWPVEQRSWPVELDSWRLNNKVHETFKAFPASLQQDPDLARQALEQSPHFAGDLFELFSPESKAELASAALAAFLKHTDQLDQQLRRARGDPVLPPALSSEVQRDPNLARQVLQEVDYREVVKVFEGFSLEHKKATAPALLSRLFGSGLIRSGSRLIPARRADGASWDFTALHPSEESEITENTLAHVSPAGVFDLFVEFPSGQKKILAEQALFLADHYHVAQLFAEFPSGQKKALLLAMSPSPYVTEIFAIADLFAELFAHFSATTALS